MPEPGEIPICSPLWVGLAAGEVGRYGDDADWPVDQREDDGGSLVFLTPPLTEPTEILGAARLHLRFRSDRPQALIAVRLNDVAPDGASTRVSLGLLNLCHRKGHDRPEALIPGEWAEATVELDDIAHAFPPGHRIALSISTTYWPIAWPSPQLATLTLDLSHTRLELPVRPQHPADEGLRAFDPAECAPGTPTRALPAPAQTRRRVTRDLLGGETVVEFPRWIGAVEMTDIATTTRSSGYARHVITGDDPLSARSETGYRVEITRPDGTFGHESTGSLTCDATHFIVDMALTVTENGTPIFTRSWHERLPRDHI